MEFYVDLLKVSMVADPGFSANKGVLWGETAAVGVTASIPVNRLRPRRPETPRPRPHPRRGAVTLSPETTDPPPRRRCCGIGSCFA